MTIQRTAVALLSALALAAACGTKDAPSGLQSGATGRIRFVNLITDPTRVPVNAILEGVPFGVALAYTGTTPSSLPAPATALYSPILTGSRTLVLRQTTDTSVLVATYALTIAAEDRTVYATGTGATRLETVDDNTVVPASGQTRFRVANMAQTLGALDVFFTATGADLAAATPAATNVAALSTSSYFSLAAGTYQIRFVPAGTAPAARNGSVVLTITAAAYSAGTGRTIGAADNATGAGAARSFVLSDR